MATTYSNLPSFVDPSVQRPQAGEIVRHITIPAAKLPTGAVNDVYKIAKLPKGAKLVTGWMLEVPDIDTNATPTATLDVIVTDGTTTKTVINATTAGQAGGINYDHTATFGVQTGVMGFVTTNDDFYVALKFSAAAATYAAGIVKIQFRYSTDLEGGGT